MSALAVHLPQKRKDVRTRFISGERIGVVKETHLRSSRKIYRGGHGGLEGGKKLKAQ